MFMNKMMSFNGQWSRYVKHFVKPSTRIPIAYSATAFSNAAMQQVFVTYYIDLFMSIHGVSDGWFYFGELVFLAWNSFDDVLFGWIIDTFSTTHSYERHRTAISRGGLLWSIGFLILFLPSFTAESSPVIIGAHFALSLCIYDGALSWVMVSHAALLADITFSTNQRAKCNTYSSVASAFGCLSVLFAHLYWDKKDLTSFKTFCVYVAFLAALAFQITAYGVSKNKLPKVDEEKMIELRVLSEPPKTSSAYSQAQIPMTTFISQIATQKNLLLWVGVSSLQVFNCHFNSNFIAVFLKLAMGETSIVTQSMLVFLSSVLPHILVVAISPLVSSYGLYSVIASLIVFKIALSLFALTTPISLEWILIPVFLLVNKVSNEAICRHSNLVVANLVDEDVVRYHRKISVSTMMFGVVAFVTKPGQSLAPIFAWAIISPNKDGTEKPTWLVYFVTGVPLACGLIQLVLWAKYTLRGKILELIQRERAEITAECL